METFPAKSAQWCRNLAKVYRGYPGVAPYREHRDTALGFPVFIGILLVGAFGEDTQGPAFRQEVERRAQSSPAALLTIYWESTEQGEEPAESRDEYLFFGHPLNPPWYGYTDEDGIQVPGMIRRQYQRSALRDELLAVETETK